MKPRSVLLYSQNLSLSPHPSTLFLLLWPYYSPPPSQCPVLTSWKPDPDQVLKEGTLVFFFFSLSDCTHFVQENNLFILY